MWAKSFERRQFGMWHGRMLRHIVAAEHENSVFTQTMPTGVEHPFNCFAVVEAPTDYAIAQDKIKRGRLKVQGHILRRIHNMLFGAVFTL